MTRISGDWRTNTDTQAVCNVLTRAGFQALFVGGCVRNALLGVPVNDIDIATDAMPQTALSLFDSAGFKTVPTGLAHGTITVVAGGIPHEITTFRLDVETFGRHAIVEHTSDIKEDARRRDFTMNALYADAHGQVIDPLGGMPDLAARRLRFIEDPEARIHEDYLRILRFFRFHAWYGDPESGLDANSLAACAAHADGLETLSKERIGAEMLKLLSANDPAPSVAAMGHAGCLHKVLPGSDGKALPILIHLEAQLGLAPEPIRRLAVLGGSDQQALLRLSKVDSNRLSTILAGVSDSKSIAEHAYRSGETTAQDIALTRATMFEQPLPNDLRRDLALGRNAIFPIRAADLGTLKGPALGEKLRQLESEWIRSGFTATKEELLNV